VRISLDSLEKVFAMLSNRGDRSRNKLEKSWSRT